jgi:hypothetical protein
MSSRHWKIFNGAPMAQPGLRHYHRRPREKPMALWLRRWFSPNGAPMAQWHTVCGKILSRRPAQYARTAGLAAGRLVPPLVVSPLLATEIIEEAA